MRLGRTYRSEIRNNNGGPDMSQLRINYLADLQSYLDADARIVELYRDAYGWARTAILNVAASGRFSSDRAVAEYAAEIWQVNACPIQ